MTISRKRIFISSVQKEFFHVRRDLKAFLLGDAVLRRFVSDVFLFEELPARDQRAEKLSSMLLLTGIITAMPLSSFDCLPTGSKYGIPVRCLAHLPWTVSGTITHPFRITRFWQNRSIWHGTSSGSVPAPRP